MNNLKGNFKIPFTLTSKRIKCLRINVTKEVQNMYTENYKKNLKERSPK